MKTYNLEMQKHKLLNTPATRRWGPGINVFVMEMLAVLGALRFEVASACQISVARTAAAQ